MGVGSSHASLATDKETKLHQLKALAYKSTLAKANSTLKSDSKPLLGMVTLKRKVQDAKNSDVDCEETTSTINVWPSSSVAKDNDVVVNDPTTSQSLLDNGSHKSGDIPFGESRPHVVNSLSSLCNYSDASETSSDTE